MPQNAAVSVENNFTKGFITEATGMNFPENGCTNADNCRFHHNGTVSRRGGIDFENSFQTKTIVRDEKALSTYHWQNVAGDGRVNIIVQQIGDTLYFYRIPTNGLISTGAVATTISLTTYKASGAPSPATLECQYSSGNGLMFVTHPYCETFYVSYNTSTNTATGTAISLLIRDVEGDTADPYDISTRPSTNLTSMVVQHKYNLYNQGWDNTNLAAWDSGRSDMPSNCDIMWSFKNSSDVFSVSTVPNVMRGNSPAPKGHFIFSAYNQNRDSVSGLSGTTTRTSSYQRASTSAFFAGRLFLSGVNYEGYNSKIYFSQIVERNQQYSYYYGVNDPTSEDAFDALPSDGGVISLPDAGVIYKLVAVAGGLLVFAQKGIWLISGSTGIGFTATDYSTSKLTSINAISASSFVDVGGAVAWWNGDGIYVMTSGGNLAQPNIQPITATTIKSYYDSIPLESKVNARGYYNPVSGEIQWLYRSTAAGTITEKYEFNKILVFNIISGSFSPWTVETAPAVLHGVIVLITDTGPLVAVNVVDQNGDQVVDGSGNYVVAYQSVSLTSAPTFKYIVSYVDGVNTKWTFSDEKEDSFTDWLAADATGVDYTSYFISGYKIHGEGARAVQPNWVNIFSGSGQFHFQGIYDYSTAPGTGRWSTKQLVNVVAADYTYYRRRLQVRGRGTALQFKVTSITAQPFDIIGWSVLETAPSLP